MTRSPRTRLRVESLEDRTVPFVHTWTDGSFFTNNWSDAANWNGGVPTTGELGGTIVVFPTGDLSINQDIPGLVVDRIDFTSTGNTLTLGVPLGLNGTAFNHITSIGANTISGVGSINLTGAPTCSVQVTSGSLTITSTITGGQNLSKDGAGTLTLTGNNTYTGQTLVTGGTLVLDNPSASTYTYTGGNININGASTFRIATTGASKRYDFQGKTFRFDAVGGGTIDIPDATANIVFSTGANVTNTIVTNGGARNAITGAGGFNLGALASNTTAFNIARGADPTSDLTVSAPLTNGGAVTKSGAGILTFTAASTYTGATTIADGVMVLDGPTNTATLGNGTSVVVGDGTGAAGSAVLRLNAQGQISNAATLTVNGEGRVEVTPTGGDSFPAVILNGGTIDIAAGVTANTGFLDIQSGGTLTASSTATGSQITGAGSFGLRGPLAVTIAVADGAAANDLTIAASIGDSAGSGTGSLSKTGGGILTLTGANTYTGTTTNNGGVNGALQIGNGGTTGTLGTGAVTNNGTVIFNRSNTLVVPNTLNGLGTINQVGTGTTVLNGPVSSGFFNTSVSATAGTLLLNGLVSLATPPGTPGVVVPGGFLGGVGTINAPVQVQNLGVIGPGSATAPGTLSTGGVSFLAGGAFGVKVAGGAAGLFDVLNVTGAVNLTNGGIFVVPTAAAPAAGTVLTVIANDGADAVVGTFAGLPEGAPSPTAPGPRIRSATSAGTATT